MEKEKPYQPPKPWWWPAVLPFIFFIGAFAFVGGKLLIAAIAIGEFLWDVGGCLIKFVFTCIVFLAGLSLLIGILYTLYWVWTEHGAIWVVLTILAAVTIVAALRVAYIAWIE